MHGMRCIWVSFFCCSARFIVCCCSLFSSA
jgi:hypothetical protein